jgi:tetratricopeptide (TPR) repeat protein
MKLRSVLVLFTLIIAPALFAQQARFDIATNLLDQQEYRQAIDMYKSIVDDGAVSGALWLNMGIAYAQLDSLGLSKYYLLQAEQYKETEELAVEALLYVNERLSRRSAVLPPLPWERFFQYLSKSVGANTILIIAFILLYLGITAFIISWFSSSLPKVFHYSAITSTALATLIFATAFYVIYLDGRFGTGVITDRQTTVYQQPNPDASQVSIAYEGYILKVDFARSDETQGWKYVRLENGMYGWIEEGALKYF